jgi:hypothetical protein
MIYSEDSWLRLALKQIADDLVLGTIATAATGKVYAMLHYPVDMGVGEERIFCVRDSDAWAILLEDGTPAPSIGGLVEGRHLDVDELGRSDNKMEGQLGTYYWLACSEYLEARLEGRGPPPAAGPAAGLAVEEAAAEPAAGPAAGLAVEEAAAEEAVAQSTEQGDEPADVAAGEGGGAGDGAAGDGDEGGVAGGLEGGVEGVGDEGGGAAVDGEAGGGGVGHPAANADAIDWSAARLDEERVSDFSFEGSGRIFARVRGSGTIFTCASDSVLKAGTAVLAGDDGVSVKIFRLDDLAMKAELLEKMCSIPGNLPDPHADNPARQAGGVLWGGSKTTGTLFGKGYPAPGNPEYQLYNAVVPHTITADGRRTPVAQGGLINSAVTGAAAVLAVLRHSTPTAKGVRRGGVFVLTLDANQLVVWCARPAHTPAPRQAHSSTLHGTRHSLTLTPFPPPFLQLLPQVRDPDCGPSPPCSGAACALASRARRAADD